MVLKDVQTIQELDESAGIMISNGVRFGDKKYQIYWNPLIILLMII